MSGNRSKRKGSTGQQAAEMQLRSCGIKMIEEIGTPVILRPVRGKKRAFYVTYKKKVSGDIRGITDNGRSVLAEVKHYDTDTLPYSTLKTHQHAALKQHHDLGGLSLLVWVGFGEVRIYEYPIDGYEKGTSLRWKE